MPYRWLNDFGKIATLTYPLIVGYRLGQSCRLNLTTTGVLQELMGKRF